MPPVKAVHCSDRNQMPLPANSTSPYDWIFGTLHIPEGRPANYDIAGKLLHRRQGCPLVSGVALPDTYKSQKAWVTFS